MDLSACYRRDANNICPAVEKPTRYVDLLLIVGRLGRGPKRREKNESKK